MMYLHIILNNPIFMCVDAEHNSIICVHFVNTYIIFNTNLMIYCIEYMKSLNSTTDISIFYQFEIFAIKAAEKQRK